MGKRIRAFLLGFSMLVSVLNPAAVLAEENPPAGEDETEIIPEDEGADPVIEGQEEEPEPGEVTVIIDEEDPDISPEPEPSEEPEIIDEVTDPEEENPEEIPAEASEDDETESEEEEDAVLFEVPEDFVYEESDAEERQTLIEENVLETLDSLEEGVDYVADELIFLADSEEYALQVAEIYHAELTSFSDGVAVITITDPGLSVKEAFTAAINDASVTLPLVGPNYIDYLEPDVPFVDAEEEFEEDAEEYGYKLPDIDTWDDFIHSNFTNADPYLKTPTGSTFQWFHDMINTYAGWNATMGKTSIKVAVLDTMLNVNHEEFTGGRVTRNDVVGNGSSSYYDTGHGNHVAGIIGATANNGKGGAGVAPGVSIIGINVFQPGGGADHADIARGINKAISLGANVVNMSLGGHVYDSVLNQAMQKGYKAGLVLVAAAGNENTSVKSYPAAYSHVISVAAIDRTGRKANYSNFGSWITLAAPGSDIWSSVTSSSNTANNHYENMSGTSMACPVVTGIIALYMSKNGPMNYDKILPILKKSTTKTPSSGMGAGIINVGKLFNRKEQAPVFKVFNSSGTQITGKALSNPLPAGSNIRIYDEHAGNQDTLIYTTDGKTPSIKNGEVVNGTTITSGSSISINNFARGTTVTFKAAVVNSFGVMGTVKTFKVKTPAISAASVKIKTVELNLTKKTLEYSANRTAPSFTLSVSKLINAKGDSVSLSSLSSVQRRWVSSNEKVATVNQSGKVTAVGPGTAKITLKILDGSKKSATCTVTVKQLAESINITGQAGIAPGSSATYTAAILPAKTNNKKVTWTLTSSNSGITMKGSKVSVGKSVPIGTTFTVKAVTTDGSGLSVSKTYRVVNKATSLKLSLSSGSKQTVYDKNNNLKSIVLFTYNISSGDNTATLAKTTTGNTSAPVLWTSSNPKVATVSSSGKVTAFSPGKTTVTCTANDGSKKKASVTVIVRNPISSLGFDLGFNTSLLIGKSMSLGSKVAYGSTYGKPSLKKVTWSIVGVYNDSNVNVTTAAAVTNKYVKISSSGKLTTSTKLKTLSGFSNGNAYVRVRATAADGTGRTAICDIPLHPKNSMVFEESSYYFSKPKALAGEATIILYSEYPVNFTAKSSSPNKIGAYAINPSAPERAYFFVRRGGKYEYVYGYVYGVSIVVYSKKGGTVTVTATAQDGSGKAKTRVRIKNY